MPTINFPWRLRLAVLGLWFALATLTSTLSGGEPPATVQGKPDICFAALGDIHYSISNIAPTKAMVGAIAGESRILPSKPQLVIHTGDLIQAASGTDVQAEAALAFSHLLQTLDRPLFVARGNHDTAAPYEAIALPLFSREIHRQIERSYYAFTRGNCRFIMLDTNAKAVDEQLAWLESELKAASQDADVRHIFVAGHFPLWIVARAGFTRPELMDRVASLLAKYKVDAYFCGHTHNKTVTVVTVDGQPITQIMDACVVEPGRLFDLAPFLRHVRQSPQDVTRPGLLPVEASRHIFLSRPRLKYYWGYQEGSTTSYNIVSVRGRTVQVDWRVLGQGVVRSYKWDEPGKLVDVKTVTVPQSDRLSNDDFRHIRSAWLYCCPWIIKDSARLPVSINGVHAGDLEISRAKMAYSPFWNSVGASPWQSGSRRHSPKQRDHCRKP